VVMLVNDPGFARGTDDLFNGKAMTYYGRWTYKYEEAARQGATGAIVIHETAPASYGWDVVSNSWSGAQADLVRSDGGAERTTYEGWVTEDVARKLFAEADLDFDALKDAAKEPGFDAVDMGDLTSSGNIVQSISTTESKNVVGVLPGTESPDEYMLFTAHWDHLGKKSEERTGAPTEDFYRDDIFNGAVDNATGSAALLEIAEKMAASEHPRSGLFVSVTLEESGLLGSAYYAENPTVPLNQVVAGINMDGMLPIGRTKDMVVVGYGASELEDILESKIGAQDRTVKPDPKPEAGYFYRSDHISFAKKGVPMLYADGGVDKVDGGKAAGMAAGEAYTVQRYHKPMDEYSDNWDLSGMVEDITALYEVGLKIINSDEWPTWYEGNEFEATRKASLESGGE
ncbi:MAG: M28 family metallopeptidase, partial [Henriciella sp.]|uniref:M28 family metallopeptidase n=1 Tax=Henriciella sp. TaxID=1968823 RepID=UPI003C711322